MYEKQLVCLLVVLYNDKKYLRMIFGTLHLLCGQYASWDPEMSFSPHTQPPMEPGTATPELGRLYPL